jgi:hypothetical protein
MIKVTKQQAVTGIKKGYLKNNGVIVLIDEPMANLLAAQEVFPVWVINLHSRSIGLCRKV